ncbi:hypothetical protein KRM28CT15_60930 [Krasilnikovia sp. M28-CT-15]
MVQYCPRGHDTFEVGRRSGNGECRECTREYARRKYNYRRTAEDIAVECRNGHQRTDMNTKTVIRVRDGREKTEKLCLDCKREAQARYESKRRRDI